MPELPEVERVRLTLTERLVGQAVQAVDVRRAEVIRGSRSPRDLLRGERITSIERWGKQLAVVGQSGRCICVHLGMTGALVCADAREADRPHTHVVWTLAGEGVLTFRDPRRFGGLWTFPNLDALESDRWAGLGEDALRVKPGALHQRLRGTRRSLKAALLDQQVVAGLGNIYVDELLFELGVDPQRPADTLEAAEVRRLVGRMRRLLVRAVAAGGSSVRDYVDGSGSAGGYQLQHRVYGRAGADCTRCGRELLSGVVGGRTTVWCGRCQS